MPAPVVRALRLTEQIVSLVSGAFALIGALAVSGLVLVTAVSVFWRYALRDPIFGVEDLSVVLLILTAASAVAYGGRRGSHVSVDLIDRVAGRRVIGWTDSLAGILTVMILALAAFSLVDKACGPERACITANLNIEHRPFYYFLGAAMMLYAVNVLVELLLSVFDPDRRAGEEPD